MTERPRPDIKARGQAAYRRRQLIGNEIRGHIDSVRTSQAVLSANQAMRLRGQQLEELRSVRPPLPKPLRAGSGKLLTAVAYNVLLIAALGAVAIGTPYLNWVCLGYGLLVLVFRLNSQYVFGGALISLLLIPLATSLQRESLADNFAVITFYFLLFGLLRSLFESRKSQS